MSDNHDRSFKVEVFYRDNVSTPCMIIKDVESEFVTGNMRVFRGSDGHVTELPADEYVFKFKKPPTPPTPIPPKSAWELHAEREIEESRQKAERRAKKHWLIRWIF